VNLMDYGVPLGRRFRALKLWFVLRSFGREGLAELIRGHVRMAQDLAREVDADPSFERTAPSPFSVVCFRYKGSDEENRAILDRVNATGEVFLSGTVLRGVFTLHLAVGNFGTRPEHVMRAWELVRREAGAGS
jgi:aromatic-L-amino-acid decarboxylase